MDAARRRLDAWTAALFAAALALPSFVAAWSEDPGASVRPEGRNPAPWPAIARDFGAWARFPRRLEDAFEDRLGFRRSLLRARNAVLVFGLGVSPSPVIVLGRDRRVFLDDFGLLGYLRGARPMSVAELRGWRRALESRARFVAAHGGRLVLAIAPENATVYADEIPDPWRSVGPSRTDQFVAEFGAGGPCTVIDLRGALREARAKDRPDDPACYPFGTHWTPRGAFAATRAIAAALARAFPQFPAVAEAARDDVRFERNEGIGDSWAGRLHLEDLLVSQDWHLVDAGQRWQAEREPRFDGDELVTRRPDADLPTGIVVHDSFGAAARSVFPRMWSRATFLWQHEFPAERIAAERPDIVLLLYGERFLRRPPWPILGGEQDADLAAEIAAVHGVLQRFDAAELARRCDVRGPLDLRAEADGLHLRESGAGGLLLLPRIATDPAVTLVLQLEVECEVDTQLSVLFATRTDPGYARGRVVRAPAARGRSVVTLELSDPDRDGRLALRIEDVGRRWTLASVVVRGIAR